MKEHRTFRKDENLGAGIQEYVPIGNNRRRNWKDNQGSGYEVSCNVPREEDAENQWRLRCRNRMQSDLCLGKDTWQL